MLCLGGFHHLRGADACFYLQSHTETVDAFVFYFILLSYSLSSLAPLFPQGGANRLGVVCGHLMGMLLCYT